MPNVQTDRICSTHLLVPRWLHPFLWVLHAIHNDHADHQHAIRLHDRGHCTCIQLPFRDISTFTGVPAVCRSPELGASGRVFCLGCESETHAPSSPDTFKTLNFSLKFPRRVWLTPVGGFHAWCRAVRGKVLCRGLCSSLYVVKEGLITGSSSHLWCVYF
ncbi:hypothetical protein GOODEAATRI_030372 [Goodea atripinnis]|uniref:Uncharacterized protein n=1 Tax=Goodea atripinnis TaxID=208336 RepID=A0ABV0NYX3_9TELE